ncbi:putative methyltransferase DDB_G0268948 [Argopecten irradians]|uniref:putative methyltransferase DDB_G0268948 n=1 Tax=Argopecten irradians TaxID=31199 RepID=UPI0037208DA7
MQSETYAYNLAIDVGCGNGQSTFPLAKTWKHVIGVDVSGSQIAEALAVKSNIDFRVGLAEDLYFQQDESVDLMTAGIFIHWINQPCFWKEATRVLRPGGVLAVYSFNT